MAKAIEKDKKTTKVVKETPVSEEVTKLKKEVKALTRI